MALPPEIEIPDAPVVDIVIDGLKHPFDLDHPTLPEWVSEHALASGGYPYAKKMKREPYEDELDDLQAELVKLQYHLQKTGERLIAVFEGRDAAGKGGSVAALRENLNPRLVRSVALAKPSDVERGQWYFQRYAAHFPTSGEMVLFDRSWYNRAGVEPVMGFCTAEQHQEFLEEVPKFEEMIVISGIRLFKFWLNLGRQMQLHRFHDRRHSDLKIWKLSPVDIKALQKWDDYTAARDLMLSRTHTKIAPWTVIRANDKRRARLNVMRTVLGAFDYAGKDKKRIGKTDPKIVRDASEFSD